MMKNYRELTKLFTVLLTLLFLGSLAISAQPSIYTLPAGTKIRVKMDNEINSGVSGVNDTFTVEVADTLSVQGAEIIPVGTIIEGRILQVKPASAGKVNGILDVRFESLQLPDDAKRPIDASLLKQNLFEKKSPAFAILSIFGGTAAGAVFGGLAGKAKGAIIGAGIGAGAGAAASLLQRGKEARIKAEEEFEIRLNKELTVPAKDF